MCEPNILIGPQKNRVPTIGAVCGKGLRVGAGGGGVKLSSKQRFVGFPPSPATYSCCSDTNFCWGLRLAVPRARASLGASGLKPTLPALV